MLVGALLCIAIYVYFNFLDDGVDRIEFDSNVWKNAPAEFSLESTRLRMVDNFLDEHDVVGMSQDQIVQLLGEPDDTLYFNTYEMVYMLGQETDSYFAIDSQWLLFDIDELGQVASCDIRAD